jgi:hypothetical protein
LSIDDMPMRESLEYAKTFVEFPFALRRFLKHRPTLEEARRLVSERMASRESNFLSIVERSVYGFPKSPYLALLKRAGCELGDLRAAVKQKGLEKALRALREEGIYVTYGELKGRKPIIRNGFALQITPRDFDNPHARRHFAISSSGSTGLAQLTHQNLDLLADEAVFRLLAFRAHHLIDAPVMLWSHFLPGAGMRGILTLTHIRQHFQRWFAPGGWRDSQYWFKYGLATVYMLFWLRAFGARIPFPEIVRLDRADVVARYLCEVRKSHPVYIFHSLVSTALRVCVAAQELGLDLSGCAMCVGGEPVTPARERLIRQVGARVIPAYGMTEAGMIGFGCADPADATDVHLQRDALALFTYPHKVDGIGVTVPAFNITTLRDTASKLLLNVQTDDYGIVEERACGCGLEAYGYTTHLRDIHSYTKLVGEGVTLIGNEMIDIMENVLPARFGGSALDYQLLEQENERGFAQLYLLVSPRVTIRDEQEILNIMHRALASSSPMADFARAVWQEARTIQVRRQEPIRTASGKLLPLIIQHVHSKTYEPSSS